MSHRTFTIGLLAVATAVATGLALPIAHAADLDFGFGTAPPIAETKVEFGTGWYVRGDIAATPRYGVNMAQLPNADYTNFGITHTHDAGYDLSLGGGYKFTNNFRADIVADFHQPGSVLTPGAYCVASVNQGCTLSGNFTSYDALINGYYDIGTWSIVTPYVGAGVGVGFGETKNSITGGAANYGGAQSWNTFAFALMAGLAIDIYPHVKLDLGYRYLNNGSYGGVSLYYHEARAGLRYMIDAP